MSVLRFSIFLVTFLLIVVGSQETPLGLRLGGEAVAQMEFGGQIAAIEVTGNQRFSDQVVITQMNLAPGDSFDPGPLNEALKALLASGNFDDVTLSRRGGTLVVSVTEVLFVNAVIFEGNDALSDDDLISAVGTVPAARLSRVQLREDVDEILRAYGNEGRYQAKVVPLVTNLGDGRADVTFRIDEGQVTRIGSVNFVGNESVSDGALRRVVSSKQYSALRNLTGGDQFSEAALFADREALEAYYFERGYLDFEVLSSQASLVSDQSGFVVTFVVLEGAQYRFADRRVESAIPGLDTAALAQVIRVREGALYKESRVAAAAERVRSRTEDLGYGAAIVSTDFVRRPEVGEIDLIFRVEQGPNISIERIEIVGNLRTRDYVVRREMRLSEGDAFSRNRLQRSFARLNRLEYFQNTNIRNEQGSSPDQVIVIVEVEETSTGSLNFGGGTGSDGQLNVNLSYDERNFLGRGQKVGLSLDYGQESQRLVFSFTEPWFRGREVSTGADVFFNRSQSGSELEEIGLTLSLGYALSDSWSQNWGVTYSERDTVNFTGSSSDSLSILRHTLRYNGIDSLIDPTDGAVFDLDNEFTGGALGGDVDTLRTTVQGIYYRSLSETFTLRLEGQAGQIESRSENSVPIADRFNLGGDLVRGFSSTGITPRTNGGDLVGATQYYGASAELRFPFPGLSDRGVDGRFFIDAGTAYNQSSAYEEANRIVRDSDNLRVSYGVGITWKTSPVGPLRLDWGFPQSKESHDMERRLSFGLGIDL